MRAAPTGCGFERQPGLHAVRHGRRIAVERPLSGASDRPGRLEHCADLGDPFGGGDVPAEGHQIAPEALGAEQRFQPGGVARAQRSRPTFQPGEHDPIRARWSTFAFGCGASPFGRPGGAHGRTPA